MILLNIFEIIFCILMVVFVTIFTIAGIAMLIIKDTINNMIDFKGDKKDEQNRKI